MNHNENLQEPSTRFNCYNCTWEQEIYTLRHLYLVDKDVGVMKKSVLSMTTWGIMLCYLEKERCTSHFFVYWIYPMIRRYSAFLNKQKQCNLQSVVTLIVTQFFEFNKNGFLLAVSQKETGIERSLHKLHRSIMRNFDS